MTEVLFRVTLVARTSITVKAETGLEAENAALELVLPDMDWEVESSEVISITTVADVHGSPWRATHWMPLPEAPE